MFDQIYQQALSILEEALKYATLIRADSAGLDSRCGDLYILDDCIISNNWKRLDYYGGFEYIDECFIIGDYKIYSADSNRVQDVIDRIED